MVKALQRLLTHSFSGKALAVHRVTENQGKKTPGVDKVKWETPVAKALALLSLRKRGYWPQRLRRGVSCDEDLRGKYYLTPVSALLNDLPRHYGWRLWHCAEANRLWGILPTAMWAIG